MKVTGINIDANKAIEEMCKRDLSFFVKFFWDTCCPDTLIWSKHLDVLCREIQQASTRVIERKKRLHDVIINVPPGTSKTKIVSVLSTCWELSVAPTLRVFVGSYSDAAVSSIADDIRLVLLSDKYQRVFKRVTIRKDRRSLHSFKTTAGGEFYAFTIGGTLTSKHADIIKIDDPLNPKQASSKVELENANRFFDKTLPTRKTNKDVSLIYLVMQRLAYNDPTGHLLQKKKDKIRHICLPGEYSENISPSEYKSIYTNGLLDPKRLGREVLDDLRIDLGEDGYAGQIMQVPAPPGGLIWKKRFREVPDHIFPTRDKLTMLGTDWDLAYTEKDSNCASACVVAGVIQGRIFIDDVHWEWLEFPELIRWMKTMPAPHYIEAKASGKSARQTLNKRGVPAVEIAVKGGDDKVSRARQAMAYVDAGIVYVRQSIMDRIYNDPRQGIMLFPKGEFSDLSDALAQSILRLAPVVKEDRKPSNSTIKISR